MTEPSSSTLIVTIDGPAGSGKSTVARQVARQLGLYFLDTGAMYRGVAAAVLEAGMDPADHDAVAEFAADLDLRFGNEDPPHLTVNGVDLTHRLRDADVTRAVSDIAANACVRRMLVRAQRLIGQDKGRLVTEGRDQGSVVFCEAQVKLYLDAAPPIRARRRALQLREAGKPADETKILQQILYRDERDRTRADGPLVCPENATCIDTSDMTLDQVIEAVIAHVRAEGERSA